MSEIVTIKNKNYKATISTLGAEIYSLEDLSDGKQYIHDLYRKKHKKCIKKISKILKISNPML